MKEAGHGRAEDGFHAQSSEPEAPSLTYLRALRSNRKTWALTALVGLLLGWSVTAAAPPYYRAHASLELVGSNDAFSEANDTAPTAPHLQFPGRGDIAARVRMLRNDTLRQAAVERLIDVPVGPPDPRWAAEIHSASADVEIASLDDSRVIDIFCVAASPEAAASLVNALAEQFVANERETRLKQALETRQWMEDQLDFLEEYAREPSFAGSGMGAPPLQESYAALLKSVRLAGIAAAAPVETVRILEAAEIPREALGPRPVFGALAGMLTGLLVSCLFVLARAKLDRTIKRPGDARRALGLRELGALPDAAFEHELTRMTPAGFAALDPPKAENACIDARPSWVAECVRGIRTSLLLGQDSPRLIVITSPTPGEGKTTVAANLAASLAESGRRTLIVDADLRRPRLHEVFGVSNSQGLVDLLSDSYGDPLEFAVQISTNLWFLPAGVAPFGGPGLLHQAATQEMLERLMREFDALVLDAPPVLAVSDARILSRMADGAILVVRAGVANPDDAIEAKTLLEEDGAHLLGVVLNSWNPRIYGPERYEKYRTIYQSSAAA
jgi:capsular exopolysaccharide synthesis family protein